MADDRIKKVRQICVSIMILCLMFFGVFMVQERTGLQSANAKETFDESMTLPEGGQEKEIEDVSDLGVHGDTTVESSAWSQIFGTKVPEIATKQGKACVLIKKKDAVPESVTEEMIYRKVTVKFQGVLSTEDVYRVSGESLYVGIPQIEEVVIPEELKNVPLTREPKKPEEDLLLGLSVNEKDGMTEVVLELNSVYEVTATEDEEFLYLSLVRPHEKYERIIVIDPGHGGIDPGTSGGGYTEASVNLAVAKYLKELLDEREDWKVYYTRLNNTLPDLSTRVEFANALHADMLVSIHCNYNPVSVVNGVEVLYSKVQGAEDTFNSKYLAELCSTYVAEETGLKERPLVERSSNLHIIKYCKMPMALIEFGYMSNRKDLSLITTEEAQRGCAQAIYRAVEEGYQTLENEEK